MAKASLPRTPYLFFGGKGGVGKTTCASATALFLLQQARPGEKILLFSTDPAHSLSDSLDVSIGNRVRMIEEHNGARLEAWEMDATDALRTFKAKHHGVLKEIAERGTMLDDADINALLDLSLPGMDEVMALFELSEFDRQGGYSRIVVDTAPSGHTSRLLELPDVFEKWIGALDLMSEKHRFMVSQIARVRGREDEVDVFLRDLSVRLKRVREILYSAESTSFLLVTIPEAMAVDETRRYLAQLRRQNVSVTHLITNRVEQIHNKCPYCAARTAAQQPYLKVIRNEFKSIARHYVPVLEDEVRGLESLKEYAAKLWTSPVAAVYDRRLYGSSPQTSPSRATLKPAVVDRRYNTKKVLIVGGKGGVGKTTTAAALALELAGQDPTERFLVFSSDPAHSLSDSFDETIGEFKRGIGGLANLDGIEINAIAKFDELKNRYRKWIEEIFASLTGGSNWQVQFDREAMQELISLAPPGIDEIAALSAISDFLASGTYTSVILDTAPTGHLLRFLELPAIALEWVRTFLRLLLKYREFVTSSSVAEELIALSKNIKRVIAILTNPEDCEFMAVAIPERMSLSETARLIEGIEKLHVSFGQIVINNVIPENATKTCTFCAARRQTQRRQTDAFRRKFSADAIMVIAPQHDREIRGPQRLRSYYASWTLLPKVKKAGAREG